LLCRRKWIDVECSFRLCAVCNFTSEDAPRLTLRGLCEGEDARRNNGESVFDRRFALNVDRFEGGRRTFAGYYGSKIYWDGKKWILASSPSASSGEAGVLLASYNRSSDYPLGKRLW